MKRTISFFALILVLCIVTVGAGWDVHYNEFHCHSDSHPDERFAAYEYSDGEISDDYFGVLATNKTLAK